MTGARAAAIGPTGSLIGVVERRGDDAKSLMNMPTGSAAKESAR